MFFKEEGTERVKDLPSIAIKTKVIDLVQFIKFILHLECFQAIYIWNLFKKHNSYATLITQCGWTLQ